MLLYGSRQIFWECREESCAEDGDFVIRSGNYLDQIKRTASIETTVFGPRPCGDAEVNYRGWYEMVRKYMACFLTKGSDRLPALSGLAKAVAESSGDDYCAGIWRQGMIEGLLWCKDWEGDGFFTKSAGYRAPSWSWAAVNGSVDFIVYSFYQRCQWKRGIADYEALASYIAHYGDAEGKTCIGALKVDGYGSWHLFCLLRLFIPAT
jgi:hypothetical protein